MILKTDSIRIRIFYGFLVVTLLSIVGITFISYFIIRDILKNESAQKLQNTVEMLRSSLDYAVSHNSVTKDNVKDVLGSKILEISDIHRKDIIIYNLEGKYLISNKNEDLVFQKEVPQHILKELHKNKNRYDFSEYDENLKMSKTSSYIYLKNNVLEPMALVYFPFYHNNEIYLDESQRYIESMIGINILVIILGAGISWAISKRVTKNIQYISDEIMKINLNETLEPIKYYKDDEFMPLVSSYNRTLRLIEEQKKHLAYREKELAWREMAKQVAHEVKNPLTPMKLLIQNFERKFDKDAPDIEERVAKLTKAIVEQIDFMTKVASTFSEFTQLPDRKDEVLNVNQEIKDLVSVFDENKEINLSFNIENIMMKFDKGFFQRILTNLVLNAQQARDGSRKFRLDIKTELRNKKVSITVEDNGVGISKERLEKVFEPNFTTKNSGMGLGLTMVKRMVDDYNGEISIRSEVGRGTSVRLVLPIGI